MKKLIIAFALALMCVGANAQSKRIKTMLFSKLSYEVNGNDTIYYVSLINYQQSISFVGKKSLVDNMWKILNTNLRKDESLTLDNPAHYLLSRKSKTAYWVNHAFSISKATAAKTLRALGINAKTEHERNATDGKIEDVYKFSY